MESLPQLILQLSIFLGNFKFYEQSMTSAFRIELTSLETKQIISILSSIFTVSFGSMYFVRMNATLRFKLKSPEFSFSIARVLSNTLHLCSRVLPVALVIGEFYSNYYSILIVGVYFLLRYFVFYIYFEHYISDALHERIPFSIVYTLLTWASFYDRFEFKKSTIYHHLFSLIENVVFFSIYKSHSERNQDIQRLFASIIFATYWLGIYFEIIYWKCFSCRNSEEKHTV
jgi:hypothetical protein